MDLRSLLAVLIGFAMLFAPLGVSSGGAMAMAPAAEHHAQTTDGGHCGDRSAKDDPGNAPDKSCCVAMCAAIAVAPGASVEPHSFSHSVEPPALDQFQRSFVTELATPPPRLA